MKKSIFALLFSAFLIFGCESNIQKKPKKLLEKEQMVNVIYDLSLLEALRTQNLGRISYPTPTEFVKKKYKIDSLSLVENTKYYASDIKEYKKMYAEAKKKLDDQTLKISAAIKSRIPKNSLPKEAASTDEGVVK
jgi:hypothetical protein